MRILTSLILMMLSAAAAADRVVPVEAVESYVNIRSEPDAKAEAISRLHRSNPRPHVRTLEGWYEVELDDGNTGFVSSDWSVLIADGDTDAPDVPGAESADEAAATPPVVVAAEEPPEAPAPVVEADKAAPPDTTPQETVTPEAALAAGLETPEPAEPEQAAEAAPAEAVDEAVPADGSAIKGTENYLVKFRKPTVGGNSQIYDNGNRVGIGTDEPEQRLDVNGSLQIHDRTSAVAGVMITQIRGETGYILHNQASTLTIGAGSIDRITIDKDGNIGFGVNRPQHPLELASGAYVSAGGVWTNSSSRARKENIETLTLEEALSALAALEAVEFNYLGDPDERYVGFIAEDVPGLVAMKDRRSLSAMDVVAVLTRVVQDQEDRIRSLEQRLDQQARDAAAGAE
jgi:hypothetical protein